jgi:hypothetical protein
MTIKFSTLATNGPVFRWTVYTMAISAIAAALATRAVFAQSRFASQSQQRAAQVQPSSESASDQDIIFI